MKKPLPALIFIVAIVAAIVIVMAGAEMTVWLYKFRGSLIEPPTPTPDFSLENQNGQTFRLGDQRGKIVLMFFGYTNCPDICPITLAQSKLARATGPAGRSRALCVHHG